MCKFVVSTALSTLPLNLASVKVTKSIPKRKKKKLLVCAMFVWCLCVCVQYLIHVVCLHGFQVAFIYAKLEFRDELDLFSQLKK